MNDRIRQTSRFIQDALQESARQTLSDHGDDQHRKGFTRAASISLRLVQDEMDVLKEKMMGPSLNKSEQALYVHLDELKSKIESGFDRYWQGHDVDWRPLKPVVKGSLTQTGKPQP